jgi:aerobic carbon-monoxide dehydrogenase large subunit
VIAPDIGGGFGNKVGAYPGYICAIVASIVTGVPVKWVEDRIENLSTTAFARDFHMTTEIACTKDGKITGLRVHTIADHGAFDACANPSSGRPGSSTSSRARTTSRRLLHGRRRLYQQGAGRRRLPLLVPRHRSRLRIERAMDILAQKLGMDPADLRRKNLIKREQFPYTSAFGWEYDSGDYDTACRRR